MTEVSRPLRERRQIHVKNLDTNLKHLVLRKKRIISVTDEGFAAHFTLRRMLTNAGVRNSVFEATMSRDMLNTSGNTDDVQLFLVQRIQKSTPDNDRSWKSVLESILNTQNAQSCLFIEEVLHDAKYFYIVMKQDGNPLRASLATNGEVHESEIRCIVRTILSRMEHFHSFEPAKPDSINILVDRSGCKLKLADFHFAQTSTPRSTAALRDFQNPTFADEFSPITSTEEVTDGDRRRVCRRICMDKVDWDDLRWSEFPLAKNLCQRLLDLSPSRMNSADVALQHPFLCD